MFLSFSVDRVSLAPSRLNSDDANASPPLLPSPTHLISRSDIRCSGIGISFQGRAGLPGRAENRCVRCVRSPTIDLLKHPYADQNASRVILIRRESPHITTARETNSLRSLEETCSPFSSQFREIKLFNAQNRCIYTKIFSGCCIALF